MAKKTSTAVAVHQESAVAAQLRNEFPVEPGFDRVILPRLSMLSQDKTEEVRNKQGKKEIKVIEEAGTFFTERQGDEEEDVIDEKTGKKIGTRKVWEKEEIGTGFEGIILFQRKQLRMYDESTEQYTSSPIYDNDDEVLPLFCDKAEVARGAPAELKAKYMYTTKDGKERSALEDNRILYVEYEGKVYQMNLRGSSMYSYKSYGRDLAKQHVSQPQVLTRFNSEAMEKGDIAWNKMTFEIAKLLSESQQEKVLEKVREIKAGVAQEKAFFASKDVQRAEGESDEEYTERKQALKDFN